jgi:uncharacterized protein YndB with AHSA1/START domain
MSAKDFTTTITVDQSPEDVYDAINRVSDWWQGEITGTATAVNDEFEYRMPGIHYSKQQVLELVPGQKVVWRVTDSELSSFTDKTEWTGTTILFEISPNKDKTVLRFTHSGLVQDFQCYGSCTNAWTLLVQKSLFSLITSGKGVRVLG